MAADRRLAIAGAALAAPGRWMNTVKLAMGLLMLASSLWLLSLLSNHIGVQATLWLGALALLALLLAVWRQQGARLATKLAAGTLVLAGVALLAGSLTAGLWRQPLQDRVQWQPLSEQAITEALAQHKRVFVDVTADWCVTCKANKFNVLLRDDVQRALSADDVVEAARRLEPPVGRHQRLPAKARQRRRAFQPNLWPRQPGRRGVIPAVDP